MIVMAFIQQKGMLSWIALRVAEEAFEKIFVHLREKKCFQGLIIGRSQYGILYTISHSNNEQEDEARGAERIQIREHPESEV